MTDRAPLLAAVLQSPQDDAIRLIYADYLEENGGEARAALIRTQIALSRRPEKPDPLIRQSFSFLRDYGGLWMQEALLSCTPLPYWPRVQDTETGACVPVAVLDAPQGPWQVQRTMICRWRRGFIEEVRLPEDAFLTHAKAIFAAWPVTEVVLRDKQPWQRVVDWNEFDLDEARWYPHVGGLRSSYRIPLEIASFLHEWKFAADLTGGQPVVAATAALSRACVRWGRHQNQLEPYPFPLVNVLGW